MVWNIINKSTHIWIYKMEVQVITIYCDKIKFETTYVSSFGLYYIRNKQKIKKKFSKQGYLTLLLSQKSED